MSAPIEVWVDDLGTYSSHDQLQWAENPVRYLRSNLTCGECALRQHDSCAKGPTAGVWGKQEPACMAFVPKEKK